MTDRRSRGRAWSTGAPGELYDRIRPGYPPASVSWVLEGATRSLRRVLDLGAGTGKLTRAVVALGVEVVAVDPSEQMLHTLTTALPGVEGHVGTAESLPLPDGCVDAVLCGQAWHWVDPGLAGPEVARVLRPGGVLGLLWNLRDERTPWVAALSEAMENRQDAVDAVEASRPRVEGPFTEPERHTSEHAQRIRPADLAEFALSRSHVIARDTADRARVLDQVARLGRTHRDLVGREVVDLPYVTVSWRTRRR